MSKHRRILSGLFAALLTMSAVSVHASNNSHPTTFLGPTARLGYTSWLTDNTAFSLLGEAGWKNYRVGGTAAWRIDPDSRIKLSGEYLWQKLTFAFFSGNTDEWVQQGAIGAGYEYRFNDVRMQPAIDLDAYLTNARSKPLSNVYGSTVDDFGLVTNFTNVRRIAGSHARGISPGVSISPWWGSRIGAILNFDQVRYDTQNTRDVTASGLGGTVTIDQAITDNLAIGLAGSDRRIFNNYAANLSWSNVQFYGDWTLGAFGDYTQGKNRLLNSYNVGLSAQYFMDKPPCPPANLKGERNLKGEIPPAPPADDFLNWTANPAIYMPQVLAIADGRVETAVVCPPGSAPLLIADVPALVDTDGVALPPFFSGSNLTFSLVSTDPAVDTADGDFVTVTAAGALTFFAGAGGPYEVIVRATNSCGTAISNTFLVGNTALHNKKKLTI